MLGAGMMLRKKKRKRWHERTDCGDSVWRGELGKESLLSMDLTGTERRAAWQDAQQSLLISEKLNSERGIVGWMQIEPGQ